MLPSHHTPAVHLLLPVLLAGGSCAGIASAQATSEFTNSGQALGNSNSYSVALGDLDGDGSLDAMVANARGGGGSSANTVFTSRMDVLVYNVRLDTWYDTIQDAVEAATDHDTLVIGTNTFDIDGTLDLRSRALTFQSRSITADFGSDLLLLAGGNSSFISNSNIVAGGGHTLYRVEGTLITPEDESILFSDLDVMGTLTQSGASLIFETSMDNPSGTTYLEGDIFCNDGMVTTGIDGTNKVTGDTNVLGDFSNAGTTTIQRGILYIYGNLYNTGTITGDVNNGFLRGAGPEPGDGYSIGGSYTIGAEASLRLPEPIWTLSVGGNLDIAIDDPDRFAMAQATIELNAHAPGNHQTMETLSTDLGASESGFASSNYPIGTLRVASGSNTFLVNQSVNSTDTPCEVLYVDRLVVEAGASLTTAGCRIYTHEAILNGTIDNPDDIIVITDCPADLDGDGGVDGLDLAIVLGAWGSSDATADFTGDGVVDGVDLAAILGAWGGCTE